MRYGTDVNADWKVSFAFYIFQNKYIFNSIFFLFLKAFFHRFVVVTYVLNALCPNTIRRLSHELVDTTNRTNFKY